MGRNTHCKSTRSTPLPKAVHLKIANEDPSEVAVPANIAKIEGLESISRRKIEHVNIFPEDYPALDAIAPIAAFCELISKTENRIKANTDIVCDSDSEIQDLLHESELLPGTDVVGGYRFYKRMRELRIMRRVAKTENMLLSPVRSFIEQHPGIIKEIRDLLEQCMSQKFAVDHFEYAYRVQDKGDE